MKHIWGALSVVAVLVLVVLVVVAWSAPGDPIPNGAYTMQVQPPLPYVQFIAYSNFMGTQHFIRMNGVTYTQEEAGGVYFAPDGSAIVTNPDTHNFKVAIHLPNGGWETHSGSYGQP